MCYTVCVDRRGTDRLLLKVCALSPVVFPFPSVPLGGSVCSFSPPFYGVGLVVLPIVAMVFMVISFLTTGIDPWRCGENTHTLAGEMTPWLWKRHWQFGNRRAADIVDWDNRSPLVFETGSVGAAPTSTARLIFENRNVIILRGNSIG